MAAPNGRFGEVQQSILILFAVHVSAWRGRRQCIFSGHGRMLPGQLQSSQFTVHWSAVDAGVGSSVPNPNLILSPQPAHNRPCRLCYGNFCMSWMGL